MSQDSMAVPHRIPRLRRWARAAVSLWRPYDCFVAYASRDAAPYAEELVLAMRRDMRVFFARWEMPAGDPSEVLRQALNRSWTLVVVVTDGAHLSEWVSWEVDTFGKLDKGRLVIVVTSSTMAASVPPSKLSKVAEHKFALPERPDALASGMPSCEIVTRINTALAISKHNRKYRLLPEFGVLLAALLAIVAGLLRWLDWLVVVSAVAAALWLCYLGRRV